MSHSALSEQAPPTRLTAAEREWIRRQGMTARALADQQRLIRGRLSATDDDLARVREQLRRELPPLRALTSAPRPPGSTPARHIEPGRIALAADRNETAPNVCPDECEGSGRRDRTSCPLCGGTGEVQEVVGGVVMTAVGNSEPAPVPVTGITVSRVDDSPWRLARCQAPDSPVRRVMPGVARATAVDPPSRSGLVLDPPHRAPTSVRGGAGDFLSSKSAPPHSSPAPACENSSTEMPLGR